MTSRITTWRLVHFFPGDDDPDDDDPDDGDPGDGEDPGGASTPAACDMTAPSSLKVAECATRQRVPR
jgi:hypothetical protein